MLHKVMGHHPISNPGHLREVKELKNKHQRQRKVKKPNFKPGDFPKGENDQKALAILQMLLVAKPGARNGMIQERRQGTKVLPFLKKRTHFHCHERIVCHSMKIQMKRGQDTKDIHLGKMVLKVRRKKM